MGQDFFSWIAEKAVKERIALTLALVISIVLAIAAGGKFFYPTEYMKSVDQWISGFEVLFIFVILIFRKQWQLWLGSAVVFAGWYGSALYWYLLELPCACMGAKLDIPSGLSLTLDLLFFAVSLTLSYLLGARSKWIYFSFLCALMATLVGYAFADWIYQSMVIAK